MHQVLHPSESFLDRSRLESRDGAMNPKSPVRSGDHLNCGADAPGERPSMEGHAFEPKDFPVSDSTNSTCISRDLYILKV